MPPPTLKPIITFLTKALLVRSLKHYRATHFDNPPETARMLLSSSPIAFCLWQAFGLEESPSTGDNDTQKSRWDRQRSKNIPVSNADVWPCFNSSSKANTTTSDPWSSAIVYLAVLFAVSSETCAARLEPFCGLTIRTVGA